MKTLLILGREPALAAAVKSVVDPGRYRIVAKEEVGQAESLLRHGAIDACLLDAELTDVQPIRIIRQIRRSHPKCPVYIYASASRWEWEEEAYLLGVEQILTKPVRGRLLNCVLDRLWNPSWETPAPVPIVRTASEPMPPEPAREPDRALKVFRDLSAILSHSLCTESLLKQFLLLLREILGVNRAVIFTRDHCAATGDAADAEESRRLVAASGLGLEPPLLEHVSLSLDAGIGRYLYRSGRILKNGSDEARGDLEIQREFEQLGAQVAIPIMDRESLIGVALFDGRLTGEFFANEELTLIFHLLEEIGLAIRNSWLHDQLSAHHEIMRDMLDQLGSGCVVIDRDRNILHANPAARVQFGRAKNAVSGLEFADLPHPIGSKVFEALETGETPPEFNYCPPDSENSYCVRVTPFQRKPAARITTVLVVVEDITHHERTRVLEIEKANVDVVKSMATHLAHEIGNSLVPLTVFQVISKENNGVEPEDPNATEALNASIRRIARLNSQMLYLSRNSFAAEDNIAIDQLIAEAFQQAKDYSFREDVELDFVTGDESVTLRGDFAGLKHGLAEVMLNGLQAVPTMSTIKVRCHTVRNGHGAPRLCIEVRDRGEGFSEETAGKATDAFFSTRNVGLGLGLTVTKKIVELHEGNITLLTDPAPESGNVQISLPLPLGADG